jgi:hypothetical protein
MVTLLNELQGNSMKGFLSNGRGKELETYPRNKNIVLKPDLW